MRSWSQSVLISYIFFQSFISNAESLTLEKAISRAMQLNPEIASMKAKTDSEHAMVLSQYSLEGPRLGYMREKNMNFMEQQMGPMDSWFVSQEFKFPTKYFLLGSAQKSKALASDYVAAAKRLEIRRKVISNYYGLFASERILDLLNAQRETLRQMARTAEARRAIGNVMQQDEMKAHVEQTQIETEILMVEEEKVAMSSMLNATLNEDVETKNEIIKDELPIPKLEVEPKKLMDLATLNSKEIKRAQEMLKESETRVQLAKWSYAPDFMFSFKKAFTAAPTNNYTIEASITVPLWFFMKERSEVSAASAMAVGAKGDLDQILRDTSANLRTLISKVISHLQLLKLYETSLIPQATTSFNSGQALYRAGKNSFLELLDSERALYTVRIAYYRTLAQYVDFLAQLEEKVGMKISSLPGDSL